MVIGKIKPTATIVAQFAAGVEVDAIQHEGKMYLPVVGMGEFATKDTAPSASPAPSASKPSAPAAKEKPTKEAPAAKSYTKEGLMDMETKELMKICKNEFGIDPDDYDGKNTNKKLRDLILNAQEGADTDKKEEEEDTDAAEEDDVTSKVAQLLEEFDAGQRNKKKTVATICDLVEDADTDAVLELVSKFEDDAEADLDEMAEEIVKVLNGEKKPAPKKQRVKKSKEEDDLVSIKDLEVGDRVSVWWDDDNQEWFDGEVKSIKKGKVTIAYDDDTEEAIDPEVHTKIKRLAE